MTSSSSSGSQRMQCVKRALPIPQPARLKMSMSSKKLGKDPSPPPDLYIDPLFEAAKVLPGIRESPPRVP